MKFEQRFHRRVLSCQGILILVLLLLGLIPICYSMCLSYGTTYRTEDISLLDPVICTWKGNKSAALSLTFDDGLASHVDLAAPLMYERRLNGTFFIPLVHIGIPYGAEWYEWEVVSQMGHEVASHSISHSDLTEVSQEQLWKEVVLSKEYITQNLTNVLCQTFCYPGGAYNATVISLVQDHYIGARAAPEGQLVPESSSPTNLYRILPVYFGSGEQASDMNQLVEESVQTRGWLVEMIHAIESGGYDPVPLTIFVTHLDYIMTRQDDVWVAPFGHVIKYIQARDTVTTSVNWISDTNILLTLESPLDPLVFNEPLTLGVSVPADWIEVKVVIEGDYLLVYPEKKGDSRFFLIDLPVNTSVTLIKVQAFQLSPIQIGILMIVGIILIIIVVL